MRVLVTVMVGVVLKVGWVWVVVGVVVCEAAIDAGEIVFLVHGLIPSCI